MQLPRRWRQLQISRLLISIHASLLWRADRGLFFDYEFAVVFAAVEEADLELPANTGIDT
jgi:hypothetical protein